MAKTKKEKKVDKEYQVELEANGQVFSGEGETLLDALKSVNPARTIGGVFFKTKGVLRGRKGTKAGEIYMQLMPLRRCFNKIENYTNMSILAKRLGSLLE